jgi:5S rRNA maturation endonuclease (ribonuclease M5)/archaellum biogenesis ATPase FlaH
MLPIYQPGQAAEYAQQRSWAYKPSGDELILAECPFCAKKQKFSWNNLTGAYQCFSADCGRRGNYYTLRRDMGDPVATGITRATTVPEIKSKTRVALVKFEPYEQALAANAAAMSYLTKDRGLTAETIKKWHLGLRDITDAEKQSFDIDTTEACHWLMIPYITKQGDIANIKYRALPPAPKRFKRWQGGESILFGEHLLPEKKAKCEELFLVEGELDAITLDQYGFSPALSTTTGAASFSPRWYDLIVSSGAKRVYLIYDSDVDGRAGAEKLVKKFTDDQREVYDIVLEDVKDSNEFFLSNTAEDFRALLNAARPAEMEYVLSPGAVLDRLEEQIFMSGSAFNGVASQFSSLNSLIDGGYGNGFLTTIIGGAGTGKTSFAIQELLNMGSQGMRTYLCCLELPEEMVMRKVINHLYHVPMNAITQEQIGKYRLDIERRGMFIGRGPSGLNFQKKLDQLLTTFRTAIRRFDLRCLAFDNMHYFVRSRDNEQSELGMLTEGLKNLAMEMGIPILALGQPRKFDRSERIIDNSDVKGSGSIEADSDNMILMWRPTLKTSIDDFGKSLHKQNMSPLTLFRVAKARYSPGGEVLLYFHGEISSFRQMSEEETKRMMGDVRDES